MTEGLGVWEEWDEREFIWLESFLRVVKWMEAQGLREPEHGEEEARTESEKDTNSGNPP